MVMASRMHSAWDSPPVWPLAGPVAAEWSPSPPPMWPWPQPEPPPFPDPGRWPESRLPPVERLRPADEPQLRDFCDLPEGCYVIGVQPELPSRYIAEYGAHQP